MSRIGRLSLLANFAYIKIAICSICQFIARLVAIQLFQSDCITRIIF